jgi:hypothetical protein
MRTNEIDSLGNLTVYRWMRTFSQFIVDWPSGSAGPSAILSRVGAPSVPGPCGPSSAANTEGNIYAIDATGHLLICVASMDTNNAGVIWKWLRFAAGVDTWD